MSEAAAPPLSSPGEFTLTFGPFRGRTIQQAAGAHYRPQPGAGLRPGADWLAWVLTHQLPGCDRADFSCEASWLARVHVGNFMADREPENFREFRLPYPYSEPRT